MKPDTQMKTRQYTLSTGKARISLLAGQTNIHKAAQGESYRVLKRQGEDDKERLADDVVVSRHGQDLQLDYADGTTLTLQNWFSQDGTSVTLPADGAASQVLTPASTEGAALTDGSHVLYAHGSPDALASMTSGHPGLDNVMPELHDGLQGAGNPVTYLPQSHAFMGYIAGAVALGGGAIALASGHHGHDNGGGNGSNGSGGGEATVQNAVQLNFVGGPALSSNDLMVEIYQADGKTLVGTGSLGANGSVTVSAGSYTGVVIVKLVNSGSADDYLDEATGEGKDLSAQLWSMGVISGNNSTLVLNINVLTTIAYTEAQEASGGTTDNPVTLSAAQVTNTAAAISSLFGVDNVLSTSVVATNGGSFNAADGLSAGEKYGLLLAAFSGAEANASATTQTILDTVIAGITLGSSNSLSGDAQSVLIKGAAAASDSSGGVSLIIDTHAPVFSSVPVASVNENSGAGQVVWTAVATDPSTFRYSLGSAGDSALFSINASTGAVTLIGNPDYESKASYSFTVIATDAAGNASTQTVALTVNNLDEVAPTFTSGNSVDNYATATISVAENTAISTVIYQAHATDNDAADGGEHVTWSLADESDGADAQYFSINPTTGAVTFRTSPDYEDIANPDHQYSFIVVATDAAGHTTSQTVTVNITDVDEVAPVFSSGSTATSLDENSGIGQVVYTAVATDSSAVSYSLGTTGDSALFSINATTGAVTLTGNPDYETKASYSFTVIATDTDGNTSSQVVTLGINNLDEVAPVFTSDATASAINENSGAGQVVYTATATDTGDGTDGVVHYSLGSTGDSALFSINATTGAVTLTGNPDYETKASYSFTVIATDNAGNASSHAVTLGINNVDETAPVFTSGATATAIAENSGAGQVVYTAAATDTGDGTDGVVHYSLGTAADSALFSINATTGAVTLTGNPDYETKASYSFTVIATDNAGNASSHVVTLGINNLDDTAPVFTSGATATAIAENSGAGQVVYTATATDTGDGTDGVVHYSLGSTGDSALFSINTTTGAVTLIGNPDYETKASYSFTVIATDNAGNASSRAVTLGINNLDDTAPVFTSGATATAINENSGAGQVVYTAAATDTGDGTDGVVHYSLGSTGDSALFSINATTGAVTLTGNPDYETKASYSFTVIATDNAGNASSHAVTLGINNLDEIAPVFTSGTTAPAIAENSGAGQVIYTAAATDTGDGTDGVVHYSLGTAADSALFSINATTGAVTLTGNPDYETKASYSFTVIATDNAGNASAQSVALSINDVVDETAPTVSSVALSATGAQDGYLNAGDVVSVTVTMDENTLVTTTNGTPYISLTLGSSTVHANYVSGSGSDTLIFQYTVQNGDTDTNGISISANSLQLNNGVLQDAAGNDAVLSHSALADDASYKVDTTAPVLSSSTPTDNATGIAVGSDLTLTFSEAVTAGSGYITIVNDTDSSLNHTINITDSSQVTISGNTLTLNPTTDLAAGANYHIEIGSTALHDAAGNNYAGISSSTALNFTTAAASTANSSIVVFDLLNGTSSDHSGRTFDANTSYTIYILVNSNSNALVALDSSEMWSGANNLGADDRIVLVGTGSGVKSGFGSATAHYATANNGLKWVDSSSAAVVRLERDGDLYRYRNGTNHVDLWNGSWAVTRTKNPNSNPNHVSDFGQAYPGSPVNLIQMPAGVMTSQGLV